MNRILLKDAAIATPSRIIREDLLIEGNLIAKIAPNISSEGARVIDCHELLVMPGLIDEHVHFREPGMTHKATIYTESRAAVLGGVTSYLDMPNNNPPILDEEGLNLKKGIASRDSVANYGFYLGAGADNLEAIKRISPKDYAALKIFMGSTTGNLLLDDLTTLAKVFVNAQTLICTHCEDSNIISKNEKLALEHYGEDIPFSLHRIIRSEEACVESSKLAIELAKETGARLHLMHLSTAKEVELLKDYMFGNCRTRQISGEAVIPHLYFSESDYERLGGFLKCNPAVKTEKDRLALIQALEDGVITTIGTDHAPHEIEAKSGNYKHCASGIPSVQFSLLALLDLWKRGELSLETIIKATSENVAARYRIKNRGKIEEGYYADLAIINPLKPHTVEKSEIVSKCGHSPFSEHTFSCSVVHTIVNGNLVVENGRLVDESCGCALEFDR